MNQTASLKRMLAAPLPAATLYLGLMILFLFVVFSSLADILSRRADVAASAAMLAQFEGRRPAAARGQGTSVAAPSGSPFLQGETVTVAGAALLQRVTAAVTKLGGKVLSSQVDLQGNQQGTQSKAGFLSVIASCEIDQPGLQQLIYDVEAGMPFLFIDQLVVEAPESVAESGDGRLRVLLTVSGQWQGKK
jgi:general secretion pathway protein M